MSYFRPPDKTELCRETAHLFNISVSQHRYFVNRKKYDFGTLLKTGKIVLKSALTVKFVAKLFPNINIFISLVLTIAIYNKQCYNIFGKYGNFVKII